MGVHKLNIDDGSWGEFSEYWRKQCRDCSDVKNTGVYSISTDNQPHAAIFWANVAALPKTKGDTLRVRHLLFAPKFDFGDYDEQAYVSLLADIFTQIIKFSELVLPTTHVKMHFRSPVDIAILRKYATYVEQENEFESIQYHGVWIVISKKPNQTISLVK